MCAQARVDARSLLLIERSCALAHIEDGITALLGAIESVWSGVGELSQEELEAYEALTNSGSSGRLNSLGLPVGTLCPFCQGATKLGHRFCCVECRDDWEREHRCEELHGETWDVGQEQWALSKSQLEELVLTGFGESLFREFLKRLHATEIPPHESADLMNRFCCAAVEPAFGAGTLSVKGSDKDRLIELIACSHAFPSAVDTGALVLGPLLYLLTRPFEPLHEGRQIAREIRRLTRGSRGVSLVRLSEQIAEAGITCSTEYLEVLCLVSVDLLCLRNAAEISVAPVSSLLPKFALAACNGPIACTAKRTQIYVGEEDAAVESHGVEIDSEALRAYHVQHGYVHDPREIDWNEVAVKSFAFQREFPRALVQDLEPSLHEEIVQQLLARGRAMSLKELHAGIGLTFKLAPDSLGPGRILAYARNPRFLEPDAAFYVLADWVETDTEKKNRIARDRIVTPLRVKKWQFTAEDLPRLCHNDSLARNFSVFQVSRLASTIAYSLPDKPVEPYYIRKITSLLREILHERGIQVGRDSFILSAQLGLRVQGASALEVLQRALADRLGLPNENFSEIVLRNALDQVDDQGAAGAMRQLLLQARSTGTAENWSE